MSNPNQNAVWKSMGAKDGFSTRAAADVLAAETRAFGNASAKLSLQMATEKFLRAKEAFLHRTAASDKAVEEK